MASLHTCFVNNINTLVCTNQIDDDCQAMGARRNLDRSLINPALLISLGHHSSILKRDRELAHHNPQLVQAAVFNDAVEHFDRKRRIVPVHLRHGFIMGYMRTLLGTTRPSLNAIAI